MSRMLARGLALWGWTAAEARSATAARELFASGRYELAVCDVVLPDGDGVALARELLRDRPDLRVVITSGDPSNLDRARRAGFSRCLSKPFSLAEFEGAISPERASGGGASVGRPGAAR